MPLTGRGGASTIALATWLLLSNAGCSTTRAFYLRDTSLKEHELHSRHWTSLANGTFPKVVDPKFGVNGHLLTPGRGTVLALRERRCDSIWCLDREGFEALTIWFPGELPEAGGDFNVGTNGLIVFYSKGLINFPRQVACVTYAKSGLIRLSAIDRRRIV